MQGMLTGRNKNILRTDLFFKTLLDETLKALKTLRPWIKENTKLIPGRASKFCPECIETTDSPMGSFMTHCINCMFPVTHTKSGACLLFQWKNEDKVVNVSVDLVPVFPVAGENNFMDLSSKVINSLLKETPPNWLHHLKA